jgi:hypothetical protein
MKAFTMYRIAERPATHTEDQYNDPHLPQFEGVVFSDGTVSIRWLTAKRSTSFWASLEDLLAVHGHPEYGSIIVWHYLGINQLPQECVDVKDMLEKV